MQRNQFLISLMGCLISFAAVAEPQAYQAENGDRREIRQLQSGEIWAAFLISDQHTDSFADNELILLQIDQQQPISIVHGLRSCAAPARAPQQVAYDFASNDTTQWLFNGTVAPPSLPPGFVSALAAEDYPKISADRRAESVDFPLKSDSMDFLIAVQSAKQLTLRYTTTAGQPVMAEFNLQNSLE